MILVPNGISLSIIFTRGSMFTPQLTLFAILYNSEIKGNVKKIPIN